MKIAISPCPNDTFLFHGWIEKAVGQDLPCDPFFADIEALNGLALEKQFPLIKVSFACFEKITKDYQLLPIGSALGLNCGPKIIAKTYFTQEELAEKTIAIPGENTTAHRLLTLLMPEPKKKIFCTYHEIEKLVQKNQADCGLIIHESRFTFRQKGFIEIADLGELWHAKTECLLPLGGLAILKEIQNRVKSKVIAILAESLTYAKTACNFNFILRYAQEIDKEIVGQHIASYVTEETAALTDRGKRAIETLCCHLPIDWLYSDHHV